MNRKTIKMNPIQEFEKQRKKYIKKLGRDNSIKEIGLHFLVDSSRYKYSYNFDWLGLPIIQFPQDILALQEIIWKTKPDLIIETGIARGGSLAFYASMFEIIGKGSVLGIDIDIRKHNRKEIEKHKMFKRIKIIEGSSVDEKVINQISQITKKYKKIMVCLDSLHIHEHVLKELNLYSKFVSIGNYLIVFDTIIEQMPKDFFPNRPWGKGNNPATAVKEFLKKHANFIVDKSIEDKLIITTAPGGFLKKIK